MEKTLPTQQTLPIQQELLKLSQPYAKYSDYTTSRLSPTPPEKKTIPGTEKSPQYYFQIPLIYNLGTNTSRSLGDFLFEGCRMTSEQGIQGKI